MSTTFSKDILKQIIDKINRIEEEREAANAAIKEAFDEAKLRSGILRAVEKCPVEMERVETAISNIKNNLQAHGDREVKSIKIGNWVMEELKELDKVAYVRFASVYRSFEDVRSFLEEIEKLEHELPPELKRNQLDLLESDGDEN